ncbi:MAG: alpha-L-fucosidase [Verrucomicrobia bacterium]|nr:alpha-L-fucosidase [Verrucomicrobiota bacterium]
MTTTPTSNRTITLNPVMVRRSGIHLLLLCLAGLLPASAATPPAGEDWLKADPAAVAHWQSLRFGMFIHWGPVSLTGYELGWSRGAQTPVEVYDNLHKQFNPTNFNADEWVSIARAAGMKYIVLTTKHHDGFCLWDTKLSDYNIMNTPFKRDVVKELAAACKKQGIEFGAYYSVPDFYNQNWPCFGPRGASEVTPRAGADWSLSRAAYDKNIVEFRAALDKHTRETYDLDAYAKYLQGQITELIKNYGPLLTVWNDLATVNDVPWYGKHGLDTIRLVRSLQPDILINNRSAAEPYPHGGDYATPEQEIGAFDMSRPWESCMTVSAHNQWAWGGPGDGVKSTETCLKMLINVAGGDGNMLLNVGPRPDGIIDPEQANAIKGIGAWLAKYGESIYGTRGGPFKPGNWGVSTRKDNRIYLHVFEFNGDTLDLPAIPARITAARVLTGGSVEFKQTDRGITLTVPVASHAAMDTLIALDIDQPAIGIAPLNVRNPRSLAVEKSTASNIYCNLESQFGPQAAFDNDPETRWATDVGTKQCWIAADLGKPQVVQSIRIKESFGQRVQKFEFQYRAGDEWKTIFTGTTLGEKMEKSFPPVTAQEFRLNILDATEGPTISEIELCEK